jgi:hypothetical protein
MGQRLNWEVANRRDLLKRRAAPKKPLPKRKSPAPTVPLSKKPSTKVQRQYIASLSLQCGVRPRLYTTTDAASFEIDRLKALLAEIRRRS